MAVALPTSVPIAWITAGGRALALTGFRGRILILGFWTYGCINCIHMLPELDEVEQRFPEGVVVVGVHSGKYINERVTENSLAPANAWASTTPCSTTGGSARGASTRSTPGPPWWWSRRTGT